MLTTYLNTIPYSNFLLIEDNVGELAINIFNYLLKSRLKLLSCEVHYLIFEGSYKRKIVDKAITYDFATDIRNWRGNSNNISVENVTSKIQNQSIIFIDSIAHVVFQYGFEKTYKLLRDIMSKENILQIVTVFHSGMHESHGRYQFLLRHLATFTIKLEPKFEQGTPSYLEYVYKKSGGKVIKRWVEFYFENDILKTKEIEKANPQKIINESVGDMGDKLTTFKISLKDEEKEARDVINLPYLPKDKSEENGKIFYQFDEIDDWDEEDPDDDLNI